MDPLVISAISAATALVASILGSIVTIRVAKRQFNANVLSANRQKWIEMLRDIVAELNPSCHDDGFLARPRKPVIYINIRLSLN